MSHHISLIIDTAPLKAIPTTHSGYPCALYEGIFVLSSQHECETDNITFSLNYIDENDSV